jgi:hypothetical protein
MRFDEMKRKYVNRYEGKYENMQSEHLGKENIREVSEMLN